MSSKPSDNMLSKMALDAMSKSLSLAATVLGFDIVELWSDGGDGKGLHCTFVHASDELIAKHPSIIYGYYPKHQRAHLISPLLCDFCKRAEKKYHWRVIRDGDLESTDPSQAEWVHAHRNVHLPFRTEMAYLLDGEYNGASIFIVGLSFEVIYFKQSKLRFLAGLGYAIYVAAFDFDDDEDEDCSGMDGPEREYDELDVKAFLPQHALRASHNDLQFLDPGDAAPDLGLGVWGKNISNALLHHSAQHTPRDSPRNRTESNMTDVGLRLDGSLHASSSHHISPFLSAADFQVPSRHVSRGSSKQDSSLHASFHSHHSHHETAQGGSAKKAMVPMLCLDQLSPSASVGIADLPSAPRISEQLPAISEQLPAIPSADMDDSEGKDESVNSALNASMSASVANIPPTWEPGAPFCFPVAEIPVKYQMMDDLTLAQLTDIRHLTDGSNANIFLGKLGNDKVIIKMIKEEVKGNPVAMHEFDLEHGMLCRISHPHIIKVLGAGRVPRRFIVLEYLGGGSLHNILAENQSKPGLAQRLFHKATFSYLDLLAKARDMADALQYLHEHCHTGATIIHRDLKPDNVGFTSDGRVKLFDFGLSTCVRARARDSDAYEMTGYTGSLRYMAPEVALRQPYTEKVDVYSFSIMVWQMARDRVPFKGFNKDIFMKQVVRYNDRPKLDSSWPAGFSDLLVECWSRDPAKRPTFTVVKARLDKLIADESHSGKRAKKGKIIKAVENNVKNPAPTQSSWF